jgi:hypothetical protein
VVFRLVFTAPVFSFGGSFAENKPFRISGIWSDEASQFSSIRHQSEQTTYMEGWTWRDRDVMAFRPRDIDQKESSNDLITVCQE